MLVSIDLDFGGYLHFASDLACVGAYYFAIDSAFCISIESAYTYATNFRLQDSLISLKNQIPNLDSFAGSFEQWWKINGSAWTTQLREIMIQYRSIGHLWSFIILRKKELRQYYDANQLLVDCVNLSRIVDDGIRREIEEELLLPVSEIEKRQREKID